MERGLVFAHRALVEHEVLQRILVTEPEILLPRLTTEADQTHTLVAAFLAPYLVRHGMAEGADLDVAADFLARMVLSYISSPGRWDLERPRAGGAPGPVRAAGRHPVSDPASAAARAAPAVLPPPGPGGVGALRPLRSPHLHRVHGGRRPSAGSAPTARPRAQSARARSRRSPTPARAGRAWSARPIPTPIVLAIIAVNVVVFFLEDFGNNLRVVDRYAMWPAAVHLQNEYYRAFTAMWLHANFLHIFFNMIALLIVGPAVEVLLGKARFLALYLIAGLGGSVCSYLLSQPNVAGIGASGAIMGVLGAYVVLATRRHLPVAPVVGLLVLNFLIGFIGRHRLAGPPGRRGHRRRPRLRLRLRRRPAGPDGRAGRHHRGERGRSWRCWPS